jgi:hypothetical protein
MVNYGACMRESGCSWDMFRDSLYSCYYNECTSETRPCTHPPEAIRRGEMLTVNEVSPSFAKPVSFPILGGFKRNTGPKIYQP